MNTEFEKWVFLGAKWYINIFETTHKILNQFTTPEFEWVDVCFFSFTPWQAYSKIPYIWFAKIS